MLERLLSEIQSGGTLEIHALAERLGTSPQMVEALLQHLMQQGTLKIAETCQADTCKGCTLASACQPSRVRLWKSIPESRK